MREFDLLISGGLVFGADGDFEPRNVALAVSKGRIAAFLSPEECDGKNVSAKEVVDAKGLYVAPGFVDIHMHDEFFADPDTVQNALIRQGVTTAIAGHCGMGPDFETCVRSRPRTWLHLSYMVGNCKLREAVGRNDRYTPATTWEIDRMKALFRDSMDRGAMGLSLGLEYAPGTSASELDALASILSEYPGASMSVHIRYDDRRCVDAVQEVLSLARKHGVRLQVSHLGSMTMGRTMTCVELIEAARNDGIDVLFDCYPYDAFCAKAGSAVYDDGFVERWNGKGPEHLEAVSGRFKGDRLTFETLAIMRKEEPMDLIVAHVMDEVEIRDCIAHPRCIIASDALFTGGGAHPRIAGTFPRAFRMLRERGYGWGDALKKATSIPADVMNIPVGRLSSGGVADIVVFDPEHFRDRATFSEPFTPPNGLKAVIIEGNKILADGRIQKEPTLKPFTRKS